MNRAVHVVCANSISREGLRGVIASQGFALGQSVECVTDLAIDAAESNLAIIAEIDADGQARAVRELATRCSETLPVVLSTAFDFDTMVACFREGAAGYLIRDMSVHAFVAALQMVCNDQKVLPSNLADELSRDPIPASPRFAVQGDPHFQELTRLSQREREVLCCLMSGSSNKIIAKQLNVSEATIKVNVKGILRKLNVSNRTQAAIWARQQHALDAC
jgi:two-component system, NarL family, nitrate/nitrite response regulator NarL